MFSDFKDYIKAHADLCDSDIELIRSMAVEKTLRRKEFLLRQGEVCRYKIFIAKGLLRTYNAGEDGSERIMQFSPEHSWSTDPESFDTGVASRFNIAALEPSGVVLFTKTDLHYLIGHIPALKTYFDKLISRSGYVFRQRIFNSIGTTAEEKYEAFEKNYAHILTRVPLHMVASYLGVSRETLSRIRHAQLVKSK